VLFQVGLDPKEEPIAKPEMASITEKRINLSVLFFMAYSQAVLLQDCMILPMVIQLPPAPSNGSKI